MKTEKKCSDGFLTEEKALCFFFFFNLIDKRIKQFLKSTGEWFYFLGNVLVEVKVIFLLDCPLVLPLFKYRSVRLFLNKKLRNPNRGSPLNNSTDN